MSCVDNVCGVGTWTGPKPGDPDNNVTLAARTVYGGIAVSWSYPTVNSAAVAFTNVFRAEVNDFSKAVLLGHIGSSIYFDALDPSVATTYFYWIQIVSTNATVGDTVGPASAEAQPRAVQTLESLTGMIDTGQLGIDLKTRIAGLTTTNNQLYQEIKDRLFANAQFAQAMADVQAGLTQALTFVNQEITQRKDGDNAIVQSVNTIAAANKGALAAIDEEKTVRVGQNTAMAQQITSLITTVGNSNAGLVHDVKTAVDAASANASDITRLGTTLGNADAALDRRLTTLSSNYGAMASDVTTLEASMYGNTATGQVGLITTVGQVSSGITGLGQRVDGISAEYFAKVQVNGLIGGFGIYNNGIQVDAGFDVDRFWIGRTSDTKVKPFIVDNGIVYIDKARIRNADIDTLKIAGQAITALSASAGGGNSISAGGSTTLLYTGINLPDNSGSGAVIIVSVAMFSNNDASCFLSIYKNGGLMAQTGVSLRSGFVNTFTFTGVDSSPGAGYTSYSFGVSNNSSGPGSNQAVSVNSSSIVVSGAKR